MSRRFQSPRALVRISLAFLAGGAAALALSTHYSALVALLGGWAASGVTLLALVWTTIALSDSESTQRRAAAEDPGRTAVYALVLIASTASLLAASVLVQRAKTGAPGERALLIVLCLATVALSWSLTHTAFTLRYAHLYYREDDEGVGGVEFPGGGAPSYFDFAYLAFTIGMCFQVSDTTVSSGQIRRTVLLQAMLAYLYNTAILAFVLNLVFGLAG